MCRRRLFAALLLAATLAPLRIASEPLVIIVSSSWDAAHAIELGELRSVYLGRRTRLFGERVRRIDLPPGSAGRAGFSRSVLQRPEPELDHYWIEQALAGGALPPRQLASPQDVIAAVRSGVGTIGYLRASDFAGAAEGVRAIPVIVDGVERGASEPGYPVRALE